MTVLDWIVLVLIWLLPVALLLFQRHQLKKRDREQRAGYAEAVQDWTKMLKGGCQWGCSECRGRELPCFCKCTHKASIGGIKLP